LPGRSVSPTAGGRRGGTTHAPGPGSGVGTASAACPWRPARRRPPRASLMREGAEPRASAAGSSGRRADVSTRVGRLPTGCARTPAGACRGPSAVLCLPTPGRREAAGARRPARSRDGRLVCSARSVRGQAEVFGCGRPPWVRSCSLMRWASSSWSSRMTMRQAASMGVPWSTSSRARAAMRSW
jgi:hypothetical protein